MTTREHTTHTSRAQFNSFCLQVTLFPDHALLPRGYNQGKCAQIIAARKNVAHSGFFRVP